MFDVSRPTVFLLFVNFVAVVAAGFFLWRRRKKLQMQSFQIYDFILIAFILSILMGRMVRLIINFNQVRQLSWSIYPYYYLPGAQRVWLKQMPWIIIKFWGGGISYIGQMIGILTAILILLRKKINKSKTLILIKSFIISLIILKLGYLVQGVYYGAESNLPIAVIYRVVDTNKRLPIQLFEVLILAGSLYLLSYLKKLKQPMLVLGAFLFIWGWMEIGSYFLSGHMEELISDSIVYIVFIPIILVGLLFSLVGIGMKSPSGERYGSIKHPDNLSANIIGKDREKVDDMSFSYKDFSRSKRSNSILLRLRRFLMRIFHRKSDT